MSLVSEVVGVIAPGYALKRLKVKQTRAYYEAATLALKRNNLRPRNTDGNAETLFQAGKIRDFARAAVRNMPIAERAVRAIQANSVGTGIMPQYSPENIHKSQRKKTEKIIRQSFGTSIDADGVHTLYGLQGLVMRTTVLSGEAFIVLQPATTALGFALRVLEPDYIDDHKTVSADNGNYIIQGIEFNNAGERLAYYVFPEHPGSRKGGSRDSVRVEARHVMHVFRQDRPGQHRGVSWLAPAGKSLLEYSELQRVALIQQKVAASVGVILYSDVDEAPMVDDEGEAPTSINIKPGAMTVAPPGYKVEMPTIPSGMNGGKDFNRSILADIAVSMGITYEVLAGDLSEVNFSSGRMGWLEFNKNITVWQKTLLVDMFLKPLSKLVEASLGLDDDIRWSMPRREMIQPDKEMNAAAKAVDGGLLSRGHVQRGWGVDPEDMQDEIDREREEDVRKTYELKEKYNLENDDDNND